MGDSAGGARCGTGGVGSIGRVRDGASGTGESAWVAGNVADSEDASSEESASAAGVGAACATESVTSVIEKLTFRVTAGVK